MPVVHLTQPDGQTVDLDVPVGTSVMIAALTADNPYIVGECGGSAVCATCHVFVDPAWADKLPPMASNEDQMLDCTATPREGNSRLSCQIIMQPELDGLQLRLPASQQ